MATRLLDELFQMKGTGCALVIISGPVGSASPAPSGRIGSVTAAPLMYLTADGLPTPWFFSAHHKQL
jgi:hypothetical protein